MDYKQYTSVEKLRGRWCTYLVIDQQSFCVYEGDKKTAHWYAKQLEIALRRLCESRLTPVGVDAALPPAGGEQERAAAQLNSSR